MVQLVEILGRAVQGMTKPFICRGEDDCVYFVKGIGAGRKSQVCEWIAGNLGIELGLPLAPFKIVEVPVELVDGNPDYSELGVGPVFGSVSQSIVELKYAGIDEVPTALQRDVLAFDWWIRNNDRTLSETGGNPNLFWEPAAGELVIIDHNQAFDPDFSIENFLEYHVFSSKRYDLFTDVLYRDSLISRFQQALGCWQKICDNIPKEWHYLDPEMTIEADIQLDAILGMLERCNTDTFWNQS